MNKYKFHTVSVPSQVKNMIDQVISLLRENIADEGILYDLKLSLIEVCANIVKHAYCNEDGDIFLYLYINHKENIIFEIHDWGKEFIPPEVIDISGTSKESGRGVFIVDSLMDKIEYFRCEDKNIAIILKKIEQEKWKF